MRIGNRQGMTTRSRMLARDTFFSFLKLRFSMIKFRRMYITKQIIQIKRPDMIRRLNSNFDLSEQVNKNEHHYSRKIWMGFWFVVSFYVSYNLALINYDYHYRYFIAVKYPRQLKLYTDFVNTIRKSYDSFLEKLPFSGRIPEVDSPEKYEKVKEELKDHIFDRKRKQKEKEEFEMKIKAEEKEIDSVLNNITSFIKIQDEKLNQLIKLDKGIENKKDN